MLFVGGRFSVVACTSSNCHTWNVARVWWKEQFVPVNFRFPVSVSGWACTLCTLLLPRSWNEKTIKIQVRVLQESFVCFKFLRHFHTRVLCNAQIYLTHSLSLSSFWVFCEGRMFLVMGQLGLWLYINHTRKPHSIFVKRCVWEDKSIVQSPDTDTNSQEIPHIL
jgi:hypothetical protein